MKHAFPYLAPCLAACLACAPAARAVETEASFQSPGDPVVGSLEVFASPGEDLDSLDMVVRFRPGVGIGSVSVAWPTEGPWAGARPDWRRAGDSLALRTRRPAGGAPMARGARVPIVTIGVEARLPGGPGLDFSALVDTVLFRPAAAVPAPMARGPATGMARGGARPGAAAHRRDGGDHVFLFTLASPAEIGWRVLDATGRTVARGLPRPFPAGPGEARWDGADGAGRPAPAGNYWFRLEPEGSQGFPSPGSMAVTPVTLAP